jgi:anaerobic magnesium-protoporphyrin IX monomethyl ester cyclase
MRQRFARPEDIAFVVNPSVWYKSMYPTGILCLANYLESKGFRNVILDAGLSSRRVRPGQREELVLNTLRLIRPKVVCLSSTHKEFEEVIRISAGARAIDDRIAVIVGGSQATYRPADFLDNGVDFVCFGEGEKTLHEFVTEVADGTHRWDGVAGLAWRNGNRVTMNAPRELMTEEDLGMDGFSAYEKIDRRYFAINVETIRGLPLAGGLLLTTRGCPFDCSFCGCGSIFGRRLRFRPLESIRREVSYLKVEHGVEGIWIVDDTFTVNKMHALAVAEILKEHDILWGCQSRVDTIDEPLAAALKECGCVQMDFGVESGSQRILNEIINKRTTTGQVRDAFSLMKKYRIRSLANFMIGLPTETEQDLLATKRLADAIGADVYVFSIATPLPGTKLYKMVGEEISPFQYSLLDWNGSDLTEKLNKSGLRDVVRERRRLKNKFLLRSIGKSIFSTRSMAFLLLRKNRLKRLKAILDFVWRTVLGVR